MYVDMHCHSISSDDSRATVEGYLKWIHVLRHRGYALDAIVLTEHRKFDRDADYSTLGQQYGVTVLKGSELDTAWGHFLVYGVTDELLKAVNFADIRMDAMELVTQAKAHGAVAIPAHPGRTGIGLCEYINSGADVYGIDIVETINGGSRRGENERSEELAQTRGLKGIAGSDAHLVSNIGLGVTSFPNNVTTERDLVEALISGKFAPMRLDETSSSGTESVGVN